MEHEHLQAAQEIDARYHQAKLYGLMMTEEGAKYAWEEHRQIRESLLRGTTPARPELTRDEWLAKVAEIDRKMRHAGLVPPHSTELH